MTALQFAVFAFVGWTARSIAVRREGQRAHVLRVAERLREVAEM